MESGDCRSEEEPGFPELTALGKRIEILRMDRRMTKRELARRAGISRQQLWRVMSGKSELTSSLCARLADVLQADSRLLSDASSSNGSGSRTYPVSSVHVPEALCESLADYVASRDGLERTLATLPVNDEGRRLKRALLNAIEEVASSSAMSLPAEFFELRREVVNGLR